MEQASRVFKEVCSNPEGLSEKELKVKYLELAKKYHPDGRDGDK